MKPSEQYAARMLSEFLQKQGVSCRVEPGANPPDYIFEVDGSRWAVEVTELHDYVQLNGPQSALWVQSGLQKVFDDIDRETVACRKRRYTIVLKGPIKPQDVATIKRQAIEHIRQDQSADFVCGEKEECRIVADREPGGLLTSVILVDGTATVPGSTKLHADIQATVDYAVSRILESKVPRLRQLSGFNKRVLCIVLKYVFADDENVRCALSQHSEELQELHTIFLVPGDYVIPLCP